MTQYDSTPPYSVHPYALPKPSSPTSVRVLAIIGIVLGSLGVLGNLCGAITSLSGINHLSARQNPELAQIQDDPTLHTIAVGGMVVNLGLASFLLISSIHALSLKGSSRSRLIIYGWLSIAVTLLTLLVAAFITLPKMQAAAANLSDPAMRRMMTYGVYASLLINVIWLIFPALLICFFSRPHVIAAYADKQRGGYAFPGPMASPVPVIPASPSDLTLD